MNIIFLLIDKYTIFYPERFNGFRIFYPVYLNLSRVSSPLPNRIVAPVTTPVNKPMRSQYTRAILSAVPTPNPYLRKERIILHGDVPSHLIPPPVCPFHLRCLTVVHDICPSRSLQIIRGSFQGTRSPIDCTNKPHAPTNKYYKVTNDDTLTLCLPFTSVRLGRGLPSSNYRISMV